MSDRAFHLQLERSEMGRGRGKYKRIDGTESEEMKQKASISELITVLKPYFWNASGPTAVQNRIRSFCTWILVIISKLCTLCAPLFIAKATNAVVMKKWHVSVMYILCFNALKWAAVVLTDLRAAIFIKVKQSASMELQEKTFVHLHSLSLNWHLSKQTGSVIKSMDRGTDATNQLVTYIFLQLFPTLFECIAVVCLFLIHFKEWSLGLVVFCGICMYIIVTIYLSSRRRKFREESNKHDDDMHSAQTESLINFETVKYFTAENYELEKYKKSLNLYQEHSSKTQLSSNIMSTSQQTILCLTVLGAMIISAKAVMEGKMSIGNWVAVQSWTNSIFGPLASIGGIVNTILQALIDVRNLSALLMENPDVVDAPDALVLRETFDDRAPGMSIKFDNVYFNYPEQPSMNGLQKVTFEVPAGKTLAIVGSTGAGKTTISRLIFRFYDPVSGVVLLNGRDIRQYTQKSVREMIGVVPQDTILFNESIMYNIRYGRQNASFEEVVRAAESAQIKNFIESLPQKWDTVVGERGLKLSGGEKQRVAIARCLLKNPPLVLLDEATSALDSITETSIQEALDVLGKNRTVLVIAHRLSTIRHADSIIVMGKGRLQEIGTHEELVQVEDSEYRKMWMAQLGMSKKGPFSSKSSEGNDKSGESVASKETELTRNVSRKIIPLSLSTYEDSDSSAYTSLNTSTSSNGSSSISSSNGSSSINSSSPQQESSFNIELGAINNV